ncbi:deleted in malignant brain tumors 1 -like protein [Labeo rohita]|uniref:Deleted in malignant brain tumors 1-like protein n=1 Tax=Labeo rohita TaxID=84645 RepID=A0A498P0I4_LABRO|nr:deleted in malignant brain tumors 1 -like protein [Labeo rohita]
MPTLSLTSTHAVVSHGENIQFRCTIPKPRCNVNAEFQLFGNGLSVSSQTHVSSVTFNLKLNISHQGSYSCQYSYQNNIKSPYSNTVNITVVNLQQPNISHSAPDGQFVVGSHGPVITRGHSFTIICSIGSQYPGGSFHLFRGSSITRMNLQQPNISHSAPDGQFVMGSQGPVITRGHSFTIICSTESQYPGGSFHLFRGSSITRMNLQQPNISHSAPDGQFVVGSQGPVITRGHSFTIICSTESQYPGGSFHLFRGSSITRSESAVNHSSSFSFPEADYSHEGTYSCVYEVSVSSRSFRSSASELLLITITVNLQQPNISHSAPDGQFVVGSHGPVITRGHSFTIICSTESQYPGGSFHLFRGSNITRISVSSRSFRSSASELLLITITVNLQQPSISHSAVDGQFVVGSQGPVITRGHSFTIICSTESQYPGGSFHLFRGSNITRMNLQQPNISHSAPDGQFVVGSQGPVITRGHSFTIICSTESQYPGGSFHLFRGSNITRSESAVNHSSSFSFPEADYSHEGNYSCVYEVSVSSRSFRSSASELLLITITGSLLPVIGSAVSAGLLLLSVLIIILLLKRRQKQRNKESLSKYSFTKGAANTYAGASHDNKNKEDDKAGYENVELREYMDHDDLY